MRTKITTFDSSLRDIGLELVRKVTGKPKTFDRDYGAEGEIRFWLDYCIDEEDAFDVTPLQSAILEIDRQFPWLDEVLPYDTYRSVRYISAGQVLTHRNNPPNRTVSCCFKLVPYRSMRRNQIHAYERYLYNIGQMLANMQILGVIEVEVLPRWYTNRTFKS